MISDDTARCFYLRGISISSITVNFYESLIRGSSRKKFAQDDEALWMFD